MFDPILCIPVRDDDHSQRVGLESSRVSRSRNLVTFAGLVLFSLILNTPGGAQSRRPEYAPGEALVSFRDGVSAATRSSITTGMGAVIQPENMTLDFERIELPAGLSVEDAVDALSKDERVAWAEPNYYYYTTQCKECPQDPHLVDVAPAAGTPTQWGAFTTNLNSLWRWRGGGSDTVLIAIVDSGIDAWPNAHPDLLPNLAGAQFDFVDNDTMPVDTGPFVGSGHGTHVAGVAAATSDASGIAGVAYCSKLLIVRVNDCTAASGCPATASNIAKGIRYAADQDARVINLSLGSANASEAIKSATVYAMLKNSILVAASGNESLGTVGYPAAFPAVIAVGASNRADTVPAFSNSGSALDVVAPGVSIWSTIVGPSHGYLSGTSMATPFVSGVVALMVSQWPHAKPWEMQRSLRRHTVDLPGDRDGYGRVDFGDFMDYSDAPGYAKAGHENPLWEKLGEYVTAERDTADTLDADGVPNVFMGYDADGGDDGTFPASYAHLPYLPIHLTGDSSDVDVTMSVCDRAGGRYGAAATKKLYLDVWMDWYNDLTFDGAADHPVSGHVEDPSGWTANEKTAGFRFAPPDKHILGNPLVARTRLNYGAANPGWKGVAPFGEVEDDRFINFVEDFDISLHTDPPFLSMGGWAIVADPAPECGHRGDWEFTRAPHPPDPPCDGMLPPPTIMTTPPMDFTEYTEGVLTFWYCHFQQFPCGAGDHCRVEIPGVGTFPIPSGSGDMVIDLSPAAGAPFLIVDFVAETDVQGWLFIDDVIIVAIDPHGAKDVPENVAAGSYAGEGERRIALNWTAPTENDGAASAENTANNYEIRIATTPIATEDDWDAAQPVRPEDITTGAFPVPQPPGAAESTTFRVLTAFDKVYAAVRAGDEVTQIGDIGAVPLDNTAPVIDVNTAAGAGVTAAPGDTAMLQYMVTNDGNVQDFFKITAAGTENWTNIFFEPEGEFTETGRIFDPQTSQFVTLGVVVPISANPGTIDSVRLTALSLSDTLIGRSSETSVTVSGTSSAQLDGPPPPTAFRLAGANPFQAETAFTLSLSRDQKGSLRLYDVTGRLVRTLRDGKLAAGVHRVSWDGQNGRGHPVSSGIYFAVMRSDDLNDRIRVVKVR